MISSKPCRFGANCNRSHCSFSHPPIVCKYGNRCRNSYCTYLHENTAQQFNSIHLIEHIERLFTLAKEQQTDFSISMNDDDDEDLQMNEFKLREKEFRTAIAHLDVKFRSIVSSVHNHHHQLEQIQRELQREFKYWQSCLPIYSRRSEIIDRINQNQVLIIKADTGSGKSTQTVQYLCDAHFATSSKSNSFSTGKIICTQPRKLAVRSLAGRVAEEYGCQIGEEIGYQVGGDRPITSSSTKVKFVTDTLFLNEYNRDRRLQNYSIVIVDEAHERKIDTDIVFGIMKRCLRQRKDLKLIIMSATLDVDLLYKYFSPDFRCEKIEIGGRTYPIEDIYLDEDVENYVSTSVTKAIEIHQSDESGDILVFLTGQDEIDEALAELNQKLSHDQTFVGLPLHGKLTEDENAKIFEKMPNIRKIIFSTNVAETSVTIDGIRHVIESGMVKEKMWDEKRKMQILKIGQITKSSVKQRRGRAGRTSPGKCYHLYSIDTYEAMDTCSRAEILCTQPTIAILKLKNLNIDEIESFEWLESPSNSNIRDAYQTLIWLDALDHQGQLTELGRLMAELNIDPKLTTMLYKAKQLNCLFHALVLAAMLTVSQNIWWTNKDQKSKEIAANIRAQLSHPTGDHMTLINLYFNWNSFCYQNRSKKLQYDWCRKHSVNSKSLQMAQEFIREKGKQLECRFDFNENQVELNDELVNRLLQSMTAGHFLNLGISNGPLRAGYQIISAFPSETNESIVARIFRTSTLCLNEQMPKYILFNELVNLNGTNYITILSSIDLGWLRTVSNDWFDRIHGENLHRISYENLTLENIGSSLLRAFVGKHNTHLNMIEETTQSIIDVNFQQSKLTIWAREKNFANVKQIVEKRIREEREKLLTETEEMQIIGRTRIVMGSGGVSQFVLVEDEFIRIILTKLSPTIDQETIENLCQPFGQIRKIDFLRSNHDGACVAVTYSTIEQARNACQQLNHSQSIAATGSYLKTDAFIGKQTYRLKAIWYLTAGKGTAMIGFNQVQSAIDACQIFKRLNYQCHYERSTDLPTLKVVFYIAQSRRKAFVHFPTYDQAIEFVAKIGNPLEVRLAHNQFARPGSVLCQGFTCEFDEEDIRDHFREHSTITDVQVLRGTPAQRFEKPDSADEELRQIFSRYKSFQSDSITFNSKIVNGRLEAYIEFLDRDDLQQAIADLNGQLGLIGNGKIRLSERILPRRESTKKTKENEYVIRFHSLDKTHDRYDLMKIIKDNQLHDHVKYVTVFRQKLDRTNMSNEDVKEFYKEEQQTGLECLRQMFDEEKDLFNSTPDCQIVSCFPNGTVTAIVQFSDPVDVLTATQTFSNRRIEMFLIASKLRLIPTITHEIFINSALTKVMTDKIQQSIEFIREKFKRVFIRELTPKNTDKTTSNRKILIDSDDLEQVTMAKIQFDNLLKGFEYKFFDQPEKIKLLFDRAGLSFLSKLQNETQTYIWSNQSNCSIRIYGNDRSVVDAKKRIDQYIRDLLKNETFTITLNIPTDSSDFIRQVLKESSNYQTDFGKNLSIEIQTLVVERQIRITGKREQDVIQCEQQIQEHWSNLFSTVAKQLHLPNTNECPICFNTANYSLQTCGHRFCLNCLRHELTMKFDTTLSNTSLRIKCLMNNCDSVFLLRDIKTIINAADMKKLARASFQAYLKSDEDIVQCLGIDCKQVYRKSKHPQLYFCDSCCKMYCVKCEVEYHTGLTCSTYQTLRNWKQEEPLAASNIGNLGYKPCPECKQIIDRYDGCNAVKCKCGIAFCWLCLKTDPNDIHSHFHDRYSTCYNKLFWTMENARQ